MLILAGSGITSFDALVIPGVAIWLAGMCALLVKFKKRLAGVALAALLAIPNCAVSQSSETETSPSTDANVAAGCIIVIIGGAAGYAFYKIKKFCDKTFGKRTNDVEELRATGDGDDWTAISPVGFSSCVCDDEPDVAGYSPEAPPAPGPYIELIVHHVNDEYGRLAPSVQHRTFTGSISREQFRDELAIAGLPFDNAHTIAGAINGQPAPLEILPVIFRDRVPHAIQGPYAGHNDYVRLIVESTPRIDNYSPESADWQKVFECVQPSDVEARIELPHFDNPNHEPHQVLFFRVKSEPWIPQ